MVVNRLGENRVLIILGEQDMSELSLDFNVFDFDDSRQRTAIMGITKNACISSGIDTGGKRVNIEALALDTSCYLLVTVGERERKFRLKKSSGGLCYSLGGSANFLDTIEQLYRRNMCCEKNAAYELSGEYFLVFDYPTIPKGARHVLSEYGEKRRGKLLAARLRESGKTICNRDAIRQIGKHLV